MCWCSSWWLEVKHKTSAFGFVILWRIMILFQVQWDEPSSILRPDRVSSWELEPHVSTTPANPQPTQRNKRARPLIVPSTVPDSSLQGEFAGLVLHNFILSIMLFILFFYIILFLCTPGMWKSPIESTTFSCDPQHRRGLYPSPKFNPSATNFIGFSGNSFVGPPSNKSIYWSNRMENSLESISPIALKEAGEKRQDTGNGCRLFGIQLLENSKAEGSLQTVNLSGRLGDDRFVPSLDAESDQQSEPSNANRCDIPSVSCDAEKPCLSPQELQSKQIRSCTKVVWIRWFSISLQRSRKSVLFLRLFIYNVISRFCRFTCKEWLLGGLWI